MTMEPQATPTATNGPSPVLDPGPSPIGKAAGSFAFFMKSPRYWILAVMGVGLIALYLYAKLRPHDAEPPPAMGNQNSGSEPRKARSFPALIDDVSKDAVLPKQLSTPAPTVSGVPQPGTFFPAQPLPTPHATAMPNPFTGDDSARLRQSASMMVVQPSRNGAPPFAPGGMLPVPSGMSPMSASTSPAKSSTPQAHASRLSNRSYLLARGAYLPCILQTELISTLPGQVQCVLPETIYSDDGRLVLLEKGSQVVGEYRSSLQVGQARLAIIWQRVKTPAGVVVDLDSPAADGVGATGAPGHVDDKWMERFGQAILLSMVQDALQAARQEQRAGNTSVTVIPSNTIGATQSLANKMVDANINVAPVLYKNRGDRVMIFVNRDVDFESVYSFEQNK